MTVEFCRATLPNELVVLGEVDPEAHTAAIGFFVKTGARDEEPALMGVSHFLEHMMFKGSQTRTAADIDREFDSIGADHNAFTTSEMTAFWAHLLPEHLPRAAEILADILRPAIRAQDFDDEKKVILEEIAMYEDQPFWVLYEQTMEAFYQGSRLSHRVLGTRQTVDAMRQDQMAAYFRRRYSSDNITVALAGRLDFDAICRELQRHTSTWQRSGAARSYPPLSYTQQEVSISSAKVSRDYTIMAAPAPAIAEEDRYAAAILAQILGGAEGSRFYWALVETGLAEEAQAQYEGHDGVGLFLLFATCSPGDADEVHKVMMQQIRRLPETLSADDLVRVRSKIATGATLQGEVPAGRMHRLGRLWTSTGEYRSLDAELQRINAVTLNDLRELYCRYPFRPLVTGHLRPE